MSLGKRNTHKQQDLFVATDQLPNPPSHAFYSRLNQLLAEHQFDSFAEELAAPYYAINRGRHGIPPGIYFRMLLVGYFEGIDSQRGIAWRCADSFSLKTFLGYNLVEKTPDHSSLTRIRERLPITVHEELFTFVLRIANEHLAVLATDVGVDSTYIEANASMKCIIRKTTGDDWKEYLRKLMIEAGEIGEDDRPSDGELRAFDQRRAKHGEKKVSNDEWESRTDPDSRIVKMKDGTTHLGYKVEHVVDLDTEVILHAGVYLGTDHDTDTLVESVISAQEYLDDAKTGSEIMSVAADNGYYEGEVLTLLDLMEILACVAEKHKPKKLSPDTDHFRSRSLNRLEGQSGKGRQKQRLRSEKVERSFAHTCETGGARRSHLRGLVKIQKRYTIHAAARNLGLVMRELIGRGTPRGLAAIWGRFCAKIASSFASCARYLYSIVQRAIIRWNWLPLSA